MTEYDGTIDREKGVAVFEHWNTDREKAARAIFYSQPYGKRINTDDSRCDRKDIDEKREAKRASDNEKREIQRIRRAAAKRDGKVWF